MYDSYKDKWDNLVSSLPELPNFEWLKNFFSKENLPQLPDFPDISMNKGELIIPLSLIMYMLICTKHYQIISIIVNDKLNLFQMQVLNLDKVLIPIFSW